MAALLLVEDDPGRLAALRAVLEPLGHALFEARSAEEARALLCGRVFLAALAGGQPEVAAALIEAQRGLPVLLFGSDARAGYAAGAADCLSWPCDPEVLRAKVRALVGAQEAQVTRLKDQFLATVSHELRTPLLSMLGWVRLLRLGKASADPAGRALESIERNALLQARLVEELLDVQRMEEGRMSLSFGDVRFGALLEAVVAELSPGALARGVSLRCAGPEEDLFVYGDEARLRQLLTLLLDNAVKFTPRGGRVRALLSLQDRDLVLSISDEGRGMAPGFLERSFEPFAQEDAGLGRASGGFGIGLATARGLVELHGGTIAAESRGERRGAAFLVTLPFRARVPAPFAPAGQRPRPRSAQASLQGLAILVVDDDPDAQYLIATMLEQFGGRVVATGSAAEAVKALAAATFDVLLSDISMAGEDGYSLMRRIRAGSVQPQIPSLALTANARPEDRSRALAAGFLGHLSKPIDPGELAAAVEGVAARQEPEARRAGG